MGEEHGLLASPDDLHVVALENDDMVALRR
jgi:hypothetical protein